MLAARQRGRAVLGMHARERLFRSGGAPMVDRKRAYGWARQLGFDQINIDLIAGMVGETWDNWRSCIQKTIDLAPGTMGAGPTNFGSAPGKLVTRSTVGGSSGRPITWGILTQPQACWARSKRFGCR